MALVICQLLLTKLFMVTSSQQMGSENYIEKWTQLNAVFPKTDYRMICTYNYRASQNIITVIGGWIDSSSVYQFNVSSNETNELGDLPNGVSVYTPNGAATLNNHVYFSQYWYSTQNFYVYDISNNALIHEGSTYPKPSGSGSECYTSDFIRYVYLIGGENGTYTVLSITNIYDIITHQWSTGPNLNTPRTDAACIYNPNDALIYVFGGYSNYRSLDSVEIYDTIHSNKYIELEDVKLTWKARSIKAFMTKDSNTIFIFGGIFGANCNAYTISTRHISNCAQPRDTSLLATWHCGALVETDQFTRYYAFGFSESIYDPMNLILYAEIKTLSISFEPLTAVVFSGQRVPINVSVSYNEQNVSLLLICDKLNINHTMNLWPCILCDHNDNNECVDCSKGILPKYDLSLPLPHLQNITCINIAKSDAVINNFNITYFQRQYFILNVGSNHSIYFLVNYSYIFVYNTSYFLDIMFDRNLFLDINYTLNITLNNETTPKICNICYNNYCNPCSRGIKPILNDNFQSEKGEIDSYVQITASENSKNFVNVTPSNYSFTMTQTITFISSSQSVSPGEPIPITVNKTVSWIWVDGEYKFNVITQQHAFTINDILQFHVTNGTITQCKICDTDSECIDCEQGVIPSIDSRFINQTNTKFNVYINAHPNQSNVIVYPLNGIPITIALCPRGSGIYTQTCSNCQQCAYNEFLLTESIRSCHSCIQNNKHYLEGVICEGGDNIIIAYNYWTAAINNQSEFHPLIDYTDGDEIYSIYCPSGFCCTSLNGCNYINAYDTYYYHKNNSSAGLCAFGRDPSSILCGKCEEGKSALFGSTNCGKCHTTNYLLIIIITLLIYVPFTIYIVYFESAPQQKADNKGKIGQKIKLINSLLLDVLLYFYQTVSIILSSRGYSVSTVTVTFLSLMNLQPTNTNSSNQEAGFCIFGDVDTFEKLLLNLIYPSIFIPILLFIVLITKFTRFKSLKYLLCCCLLCDCCPLKLFDKEPFIKKSVYRILLLYTGTIVTTLFQLVTIIHLPNGKYIYYNAPDRYVDIGLFMIAIVGIFFVFLLFLYFWYRLKIQPVQKRHSPNNKLRSFIKSFNRETWYWQFIILIRRCSISLYAAFQFLEPVTLNIILAIVLLFFILLNKDANPYKYRIANHMETLCLCCLLIILIGLNFDDNQSTKYFQLFVSFFMFLPLLGFVLVLLNILYILCGIKKSEIKDDINYFCKCICCDCIGKKHSKSTIIDYDIPLNQYRAQSYT